EACQWEGCWSKAGRRTVPGSGPARVGLSGVASPDLWGGSRPPHEKGMAAPMDLGLKGMKAIVTGGTRGIGHAVASLLAAEGCDVAICARSKGPLDETVAALARHRVKATGGVVDVADLAA